MVFAINPYIPESRQLVKSLQTLGGTQMTYFEVLIESFEHITENRLQNRVSWEHRWCRLLPWAAAGCQGHSKMVMSSSLTLPLPVPGEIRFAAAARAGIRMCEMGASCLQQSLLLPGHFPSGSRSCLRWDAQSWFKGLLFLLVNTEIFLTSHAGLLKSCRICSLHENG